MAKSSNQKLKALYVMKILSENTDAEHPMPLNRIAELLEGYGIGAERKSLYDDFELLRGYGLDIEIKRGKNTGYYIANRTFELPELKLLVDAVQSSKFITRKKSDSLIKKLEGLTSRYEAQQLHRQVFVANRIKTMNESIYYSVDYIHSAIISNQKIEFRYFDWNEKKEKRLRHDGAAYRVSPWALTWDDDNYYLIAYDDAARKIKHYRVDKMTGIQSVDEPREGAEMFENFDMALYSTKTFSMYGGRDEYVKLRCKNSMANIIIDRFGRDISLRPDGDEHFEVTVKVSVSPPFLTWLIGFGDGMRVVSPTGVIDELIQTASKAIEQYKK